MKSPLFAYGTSTSLKKYIESDKFLAQGRILYCYETDTELWAFVQTDGTLYHIVGNNKSLVQKVDTLPEIEDADEEVLYICNNVVYVFNGELFIPSYQNVSDEITSIQEAIANMYTKDEVDDLVGDISGETTIADYVTNTVATALQFEEV